MTFGQIPLSAETVTFEILVLVFFSKRLQIIIVLLLGLVIKIALAGDYRCMRDVAAVASLQISCILIVTVSR